MDNAEFETAHRHARQHHTLTAKVKPLRGADAPPCSKPCRLCCLTSRWDWVTRRSLTPQGARVCLARCLAHSVNPGRDSMTNCSSQGTSQSCGIQWRPRHCKVCACVPKPKEPESQLVLAYKNEQTQTSQPLATARPLFEPANRILKRLLSRTRPCFVQSTNKARVHKP